MDVDVRVNMLLKLHTVGLVKVRSIAISMYVCLSVCLSVRSHILITICLNFVKFSLHIPLTVARSSSDGNALRCVIRVCG